MILTLVTVFNTLHIYPTVYQEIIDKEYKCGWYISPFSRKEVESLIGPFQSSPLSLVPKPRKPGKFHAVHNFSHPHRPAINLSSINYTIDSNMYPCTWGTFATIYYTIHNLPLGSQASIQDVAEAYHTIPVTSNQWPGLIVKLCDDNSFAINTTNNFGLSSAGGIYGELGDIVADLFWAHGMGPLSKWVNDHIFFHIGWVPPLLQFQKSAMAYVKPSQTMEAECSEAGFCTMARHCLMTFLRNLMRMLQIQFRIIQMFQIALLAILYSHIAVLILMSFQTSSSYMHHLAVEREKGQIQSSHQRMDGEPDSHLGRHSKIIR